MKEKKHLDNFNDHVGNSNTPKLKIGDHVNIIDKNHVGFGKPDLVITNISKHRHDATITLYDVESSEHAYFCRREKLEKIKL